MRYTMIVPNWTPPNINDAMGKHWRSGARLKKEAALILGAYRMIQGVKVAAKKRRVTITVRGWHAGTLPDPTNLVKLTLDALKTANLIVDDSGEWCECPEPVVERAGKGEVPSTTFFFEDL